MLMMLMWATGCTPDRWKESNTILLFKNKGTILNLDYYRRIGLENTVYKFWTKVVQGAFAAYAEKHGILSQEQGGFRAHKNTIHQLELHTMLLEDARLTGQDIFTLMVDLKEAFDTIDHQRMHKILRDLGYPEDAIRVVQGLYNNAITQVVTPYGRTTPIQVQRGTLQGDSLSPFLFILYLEPLLRWLQVGGRGYQPGVLKKANPLVTYSNGTYADDLTVYTEGHSNLVLQADKVSQYATWGGLIISHTKTIATAAMYRRQPSNPLDKALVQRLIANITMQGKPITAHDPQKPYKLLGVWFTMGLNWRHQHHETCKSLRAMADALAKCYNSQGQKLRCLQSCLRAKVQYAFPLMCYSEQELNTLDKILDSVVRTAYSLPKGTPTAMLREDVTKGGLGNTSLSVAYTTIAIKNITHAESDQGKRGLLTRALTQAQLKAFTHPSATDSRGWMPDYSLRLRQIIQGTKAGMYMWQGGDQRYPLPNTQVAQTIMGNTDSHEGRDPILHKLRKPLKKLQEIGVYSIDQATNRKATRVLLPHELARSLGLSTLASKHKIALLSVARLLSSPPNSLHPSQNTSQQLQARGQTSQTTRHNAPVSWMATPDEYRIHPERYEWTRRKIQAEKEYRQVPRDVIDLLLQSPPLQGPPVHMSCGGKRPHKLVVDPEFREPDPNLNEHHNQARTQPQTEDEDQHEIADDADLAEPCTDAYQLTRWERAQRLLNKRTPAVTVYNTLCAWKDHGQAVPTGQWRLRAHHTRWKCKQRQLKRQQVQWEVQWGPSVLEGWEKDLAIDRLNYNARVARPATPGDMAACRHAACEHCHGWEEVEKCTGCHRGFHQSCPINDELTSPEDDGLRDRLCRQCRKYAGLSERRRHHYQQTVQHWYIEWEPQWEDEQTMKGLGFGQLVQQTKQAIEHPPSHPPPVRLPKDHHLSNKARQGNDCPQVHNTVGDNIRQRCSFVLEDTDPHTDIVGTGRYVLQHREVLRRHTLTNGQKKDLCKDMVTVHDPTGRTVGMLEPQRVATLHRNYQQVIQGRPDIVQQLNPRPFPEELAGLLRRYKNGTPMPGCKRRVDLTNHWATPAGIYATIQRALPGLSQERFASPLNYHIGMDRYWSCFERDQLFGAFHDAYSCQWTGLSVANPEYDAREMYKAVSWAVHSAHLAENPHLGSVCAASMDGREPHSIHEMGKQVA
jgi:hypothetical protein